VKRKVFEEAIVYLERADAIAAKNPDIVDTYAWVVYQSGGWEGACKIVRNGGDYYTGSPQLKQHCQSFSKIGHF
jgi:hypothetical protein